MTGAFLGNSKVATRFAPFRAVRQNPSSGAGRCKQMCQLVPQGAVDLGEPKFLQSRIQHNEGTLKISPTHGGAHPIVPAHPQTCCQTFCLKAAQKRPRALL
jgi:hypothetical protein